MSPAGFSLTARNMTVLPSASRDSALDISPAKSTSCSRINLRLPSKILYPSALASIPCPGIELNESGSASFKLRTSAPRTIASPSGCSEFFSAIAASRRTVSISILESSESEDPFTRHVSATITSVTEGSPFVRVPVLSNTMVCNLLAFSIASAPLKSTPNSAALPVPAIMADGVASPTAQGQEMTSTVTESNNEKPNTPISPSLYGERIKLELGSKNIW